MKKIMMVDDEKDQLYTMKKVLEKANNDYEFIPVTSGPKCLKLLKDAVIPDIIFLDIMMPEMSGWQVFDKIKSNPDWKNIPIVFLTVDHSNYYTSYPNDNIHDPMTAWLEEVITSEFRACLRDTEDPSHHKCKLNWIAIGN